MKKSIFIFFGLLILNSCIQKQNEKKTTLKTDEAKMTERKKFDISKLTEQDKEVLNEFYERRKLFDKYISENKLERFTCPGCGYPTLSERGGYEICDVCNWEDDGQDEKHANEVWGGPNYGLALTENRLNIGKTLKGIADSLGGIINSNPDEIMKAFSIHNERMNSFDEDKMMNALRDDPIWKEWEKQSKEILKDLIKK